MKNKLFAFFIPFIFLSCSLNNKINLPQSKKENVKNIIVKEHINIREDINENIKLIVKDIIKLFVAKDLITINKKYVHPKYGFYDLFKIDGYESFINDKMVYNILEEETEELNHILLRADEHAKDFVVIEQDIKFNCSPQTDEFYGWNGDGLYISYNTNNNLSTMLKETNKHQKNKYSKEEIKRVEQIEQYSYKVILTPEIIFYLTKFDNRYYISLFDRITTNCSSPKEE